MGVIEKRGWEELRGKKCGAKVDVERRRAPGAGEGRREDEEDGKLGQGAGGYGGCK